MPTGSAPTIALAGDRVLVTGTAGPPLSAYALSTGTRLWTDSSFSSSMVPELQVVNGVALITNDSVSFGPHPTWPPADLMGFDLANGRLLWTFDPKGEYYLTVDSGGPDGLVVSTSQPRELYLLNARTGAVTWSVATAAVPGSIPLELPGPLIPPAVPPGQSLGNIVVAEYEGSGTYLVDRYAASGAVKWRTPLSAQQQGPVATRSDGLLLVTGAERDARVLQAFRLSDGSLAWQVTMPATVQPAAQPSPGGGGIVEVQKVQATTSAGASPSRA